MSNMKKNFELFLLAIGVVFVWRGVWGLSDLYLFPDNETFSFILSIIVGILILYFSDKKLNELF